MLNHGSLSLQQAVRKRGRPAFSRKSRGGDPQYFKRFGPFLADALGLARPETPGETLQSAIQQGLVSLPLLWWGGSVMMTRQSVTAVPTLAQATGRMLAQATGRMLAGSPKADVAGTVGAATAGTLAQQHGAGPFGTIAAAAAGAMAGGKAVLGGAAARGGGSAAAKGVGSAEDAALGARMEAKAAGGTFDGHGSLFFEDNKWNYLFGRVASNKHNQERSIQLKETMEKLGIKETPESQKILLDHLDEVARSFPPLPARKEKPPVPEGMKTTYAPTDVVEKHSFFTGPSGITVKLETIFRVCDDGSLRFITTIPKYLKSNYGAKQ